MKKYLIALVATAGLVAATNSTFAQGTGCSRFQSVNSEGKALPPSNQSDADAEKQAG